MAKKRAGKSGSEHIREYLQENPDASPSQIVEGLAERGVTVSPSLAGNVKYTSGAGRKRRKKKVAKRKMAPGGAVRKAITRKGGDLTADDLLEAKNLVSELGGFDEARKALDALEKLQ